MSLIKRLVKGTPLTFAEGDANLNYLETLANNTGSFATTGSNTFVGTQTISGSSLFTTKVKIGPDIGNGINTSFANALEIGSNPDAGTGGALFLGNTLGSSTWGIVSNGSDNLAIANQSGFQSRAVTLYNTENKIEFLYSGSLNANGAGFHNIRFDENGIIPGQTNKYDLGSVTNVWKNLYISTAILSQVSQSFNFANDLAASGSGIPLGGLYHTSGTIKIRLV